MSECVDKKSTAPAFGAGAVYVVLTGSLLLWGYALWAWFLPVGKVKIQNDGKNRSFVSMRLPLSS